MQSFLKDALRIGFNVCFGKMKTERQIKVATYETELNSSGGE